MNGVLSMWVGDGLRGQDRSLKTVNQKVGDIEIY